jgi:hypothetical protein
MSHFSAKSLSFYAVAISSVLILFRVVSAYGETHLVASPKIGGKYELSEGQSLPECLANQALSLTVEQSGRYLFAKLGPQSSADFKTAEGLFLSGSFKDNVMSLTGQGNLANCDPAVPITVQGRLEDNRLVGKLQTGDVQSPFTAQYQPPAEKPAVEGGH